MADTNTIVPTEPAGWPKAVGIISIVWAGLNLACGLCGIGYMLMAGKMMAGAEAQFGPVPDVVKPSQAQIILSIVGMIGPVILLIAGITTLRRRPTGRVLHLVYAVIAIVLGGAGAFVAMKQQFAIVQWAKDHPADKWVTQGHVGSPISLVISAAIMLIMFVWPLFCMIWFGAIKRDTKDLDGGDLEPGV